MFVELIESLRCPRLHEESALVASASRTVDRHIVDGTLGCPVCGAEFPIVDGIARFGTPASLAEAAAPSGELAMRLAAFLELTDGRGFAILCGRWAAQADQVRRLAETPLVVLNAPAGISIEVAGRILATDVAPFAAAVARAVALDAGMSDALVASAVRSVRERGRVLGPAALALPDGVTLLASDERLWVAERNAAPERAPRLVTLSRPAR